MVTFNFSCDEKVADEYGFKLNESSYEYTVEGLKDSEAFDVLQYFDVEFTGLDGEGQAKIVSRPGEETKGDMVFKIAENSDCVYCENKSTDYSSRINVVLDESSYLSTGNTVTLKADVTEDQFAGSGIMLTNLSKEFTVGTLGRYVSSLSEIEGVITDQVENHKQKVMDWIYNDWSSAVHDSWRDFEDQKVLSDMTLYRMCLTTPKSSSSDTHNTLWLIYTVKLNDDRLEDPTDVYFAVRFDNIALDGEGNFLGNMSDGEWQSSMYGTRYHGTTDYTEFYNDNIDTFRVNVEESK